MSVIVAWHRLLFPSEVIATEGIKYWYDKGEGMGVPSVIHLCVYQCSERISSQVRSVIFLTFLTAAGLWCYSPAKWDYEWKWYSDQVLRYFFVVVVHGFDCCCCPCCLFFSMHLCFGTIFALSCLSDSKCQWYSWAVKQLFLSLSRKKSPHTQTARLTLEKKDK